MEPPSPGASPSWRRLRAIWGNDQNIAPYRGEVPSVVDCEILRLLRLLDNGGSPHCDIEEMLAKHSWDYAKCCEPGLSDWEKHLPRSPSTDDVVSEDSGNTPGSGGTPPDAPLGSDNAVLAHHRSNDEVVSDDSDASPGDFETPPDPSSPGGDAGWDGGLDA